MDTNEQADQVQDGFGRRSLSPMAEFHPYIYVHRDYRPESLSLWSVPAASKEYTSLLKNKLRPGWIKHSWIPCLISRDSIAGGWVFVVKNCFFAALDMKYTDRVILLKKEMILTQGIGYRFATGDTIRAASRKRDLIVQIVSASPVTKKHAGNVRFQFFLGNDTWSGYQAKRDFYCTQAEFVRLLKDGSFFQLNGGSEVSLDELFPDITMERTEKADGMIYVRKEI